MTTHNHFDPADTNEAPSCNGNTEECLRLAIDLLVRCAHEIEGSNRVLYRDLTAFFMDLSKNPPPVEYTHYV